MRSTPAFARRRAFGTFTIARRALSAFVIAALPATTIAACGSSTPSTSNAGTARQLAARVFAATNAAPYVVRTVHGPFGGHAELTIDIWQRCDGVSLCDESSLVYPRSHGKPAHRTLEALQIGERGWSLGGSCAIYIHRSTSAASLFRWAIPRGAYDWEHSGPSGFAFTVSGHGYKAVETFKVVSGRVSAVRGVTTLREKGVTAAGASKAKTVSSGFAWTLTYAKAPPAPRPPSPVCQT